MFVDQVEIVVRSGKGGDGVVHFRREKYVPRGGPDGGDGGRGGDVIFEVASSMASLESYQYESHFNAQDGAPGGGSRSSGKSGEALVLRVPPGTVIFDKQSGTLLADLVQPGEHFLAAKGGQGGAGNAHFATSSHQTPRIAFKGDRGERRELTLELRIIADVGVIGKPNAGKSSLLAAMTKARPKIGDYPFTTLTPNLGVATFSDDNRAVIADVPGLIEGAHSGSGLGQEFLRHIERCKVLLHVVDGLSDDPLRDCQMVNEEMRLYDPALVTKPQLVVFNKMDLDEVRERWEDVEEAFSAAGVQLLPVSAISGMNLDRILTELQGLLETIPQPATPQEEALPVYRPAGEEDAFSIERLPGGWRVHGKSVEHLAATTYWQYEDSVRYFQKALERMGVDEALRRAGVREGDTVFVGQAELEWED